MVRALIYVVLVFAVAAGFVWLADHPGEVTLVWQGYQIRTSLMVAGIALAAILAVSGVVYVLLRTLVRSPRRVGQFLGARRRDRGYHALSRGLVAIGAGDSHAATRYAAESRHLLRDDPMTLLLAAQAAQLAGDANSAIAAFRQMLQRQDTAVLGLHGLFMEAKRRGDRGAAKGFALQATRLQAGLAWAGLALFEYQAADGEWAAALETLAANTNAHLVDKASARRLQAVLLTARATTIEAGLPEEARTGALEAHRLAPELVPAAVLAARLSARLGDLRRAARVLETTWKADPHPEIAAAYGALRPGDSVRDRLKRIRTLAQLRPNHPEGELALARAAIDAHEWAEARATLRPLLEHPTERACLMMAEIEDGENGDAGRTRDWLTRALRAPPDAAWVADGYPFESWAAVSPVSGRVDAFEWKAPVDRLAHMPAALERGAPPSLTGGEHPGAAPGHETTPATGLAALSDDRPARTAADDSDIDRAAEEATIIVPVPTSLQAPSRPAPPAPVVVIVPAHPAASSVHATALGANGSAASVNGGAPAGIGATPGKEAASASPDIYIPPPPDDPGPEPDEPSLPAVPPARRFAAFR